LSDENPIDLASTARSDLRRALTAPRSVALIGASNDPGRVTARPLQYLRKHGYRGEIYPVNPGRETVLGEKAYASLEDIRSPIEHAYIMVNTKAVTVALENCIEIGVPVVSILADGFAETGEQGLKHQRQLRDLASEAGVLLIGPNSMGVVDTRSRFTCTTNAAFSTDNLATGRTAVISQSGSLIGTILSRGQARGLSYSTLLSLGNEAHTGVGEIGCTLVDDPETDAFILFLETLRNVDAITEFAERAHQVDKPIVAYMTGLSSEGQALSRSHTGAMIGAREATDAYLHAVGIERVSQFESLLEAPQALRQAIDSPSRRDGVTVISTTGGGGAMLIDQLSVRGVPVLQPSEGVRKALAAHGLGQGSGKLIDVTLAGARYEVMKSVLDYIIRDPGSGIVVVAIGSSAQFNPEIAVRPIIDAVTESNDSLLAPVLAFPVPQAEQSLRLLAAAGIASFRTVESCAESISLMMKNGRKLISRPTVQMLTDTQTISARLADLSHNTLTETEASDVMQCIGIERPAHMLLPARPSVPENLPIQFPCVVKLVSRDITHKSDVGAVRTGIDSRNALIRAIDEMRASLIHSRPQATLEGILIQATENGICELLVGAVRDPLVGAVITVGLGGRTAELYQDTATRPAPVSAETARNMLQELKLYPLLNGYRGAPAADVDAAADAIAKLSELLLCDRISEAEINPLLVRENGRGVVLLDAVIELCVTDNLN